MPVRPYNNKSQFFLLPPSVNEWVRSDHPAWVLSDIVDHLDVSGFRTVSTEGRPCYDPRMMVKVLSRGYTTVYVPAGGLRSGCTRTWCSCGWPDWRGRTSRPSACSARTTSRRSRVSSLRCW
jgi:hypothetical protein